MQPDERGAAARELFMHGCGCAQAVLGAFAQETGLDPDTALRLAAPFGGGVGRTRGLCGAVSGMLMAAGLRWGQPPTGVPAVDAAQKKRIYQIARDLMDAFAAANGSIICRELLAGAGAAAAAAADSAAPEVRSATYYKKRPCPDLVACAAAILEGYTPHD